MKLYKLSQGSTFDNLKHFIYLTNEYGVPSSEFVDAFIDQFGKVILIGNFTIEEYHCKILDELWKDIVKDCTNNNVEYKENYSSLFYTVLSTKALAKIKEGYEQSEWNKLEEQKKLNLLRQFILDFDNHIQDGIDENENTTVKKQIKHYILTQKFRGKMSDSILTYNKQEIGKIVSDSEILYNGESVDIGECIYRQAMKTELIKVGPWKFDSLYEEITNI